MAKRKFCKSKIVSDAGNEYCQKVGKHVWHGYTILLGRNIMRISWRKR